MDASKKSPASAAARGKGRFAGYKRCRERSDPNADAKLAAVTAPKP